MEELEKPCLDLQRELNSWKERNEKCCEHWGVNEVEEERILNIPEEEEGDEASRVPESKIEGTNPQLSNNDGERVSGDKVEDGETGDKNRNVEGHGDGEEGYRDVNPTKIRSESEENGSHVRNEGREEYDFMKADLGAKSCFCASKKSYIDNMMKKKLCSLKINHFGANSTSRGLKRRKLLGPCTSLSFKEQENASRIETIKNEEGEGRSKTVSMEIEKGKGGQRKEK